MTDLLARLKEQAEWHSDGHGPLHKEAAAEIEQLHAALHNFTFPAYPDKFLSEDGGCTEAIVPDEHVQLARKLTQKKAPGP